MDADDVPSGADDPATRSRPRRRAVVAVDDAGVVRAWDTGAEEMFGHSAASAVGRLMSLLIVPEWLRDAHIEGFRRYVESGHRLRDSVSWEVPALRADGTTITVAIDLTTVTIAGTDLTIATMREVLRDESSASFPALLETLFDRAPEIITLVDADGRQFRVNDAGARMLGYDPVMQTPPWGHKFVHPDDLELMQELRRNLTVNGRPASEGFRFRVHDASGNWRWLEAQIVDLLDVPGVEARVVFSRDVTEAVEDRAALALARAEAEQQAQQLREFDEARNDFVTAVTHEFRTPLTSLLSGAGLILDGHRPLDPESRAMVEILQRNAERLRDLVENLLLVSRLDAGMQELVLDDVDVVDLLQERVWMARDTASPRGVTIELVVDGGGMVRGDRQQLSTMLDNVICNAAKFTSVDTVVRVESRSTAEMWTVDVIDQGPGIAPGEEERIFQRYARGSATTGVSSPGTGLGLAIARGIAELHGGHIEVDSTRARGSRFRMVVPTEPVRSEARP